MPVTSVLKDPGSFTMTITAEYLAPVERVWQVWADPRQLEQWWGPPTYPATVVGHDLDAGGEVTYFMTGPEGDQHHGWWRIRAVDPPRSLEFDDGFADANGDPDPNMPITLMRLALTELDDGGTRMDIHTTFPSEAVMVQLVAMGMEEGMTQAVGQVDALLM